MTCHRRFSHPMHSYTQPAVVLRSRSVLDSISGRRKDFGAEPIRNLGSYPLQYHQSRSELTAGRVECGRKFISLMGGSHRHCCGSAFYMQDDIAIQVSVDSRVMIDPAFFRKINPNYSRPQVSEKERKNRPFSSSEKIIQRNASTESRAMEESPLS
jgi:hypothetical protein